MDAVAEVKVGRREKNKIANRQAILDAGLEVFSTIGYDAATISDLVKASGLSVGTFYNYYGDKDVVFAELVDGLLSQSKVALTEARTQASTLEEFVNDAFNAYSRVIFLNPGMQRLIVKNTQAFRQFVFGGDKIEGIFSDLEKDMATAIKQGILPNFPVRLMTSAIIGAGAEVFAFEGDVSGANPEEKAQFLSDLFLGGMRYMAAKNEK